jgi:hypothetical protein
VKDVGGVWSVPDSGNEHHLNDQRWRLVNSHWHAFQVVDFVNLSTDDDRKTKQMREERSLRSQS